MTRTWTIDPVHSSVEFGVEHLGIATFKGRFRTLQGTLELDEADPARSTVTAAIDVASVDVVNERLYGRLMDDEFFGKEHTGQITFRSTRVEPAGDKRWRVSGDLTIRGATRPVMLDTRELGRAKSPFSGKMVAAFRAETAIDREDFGLVWNAQLETGGPYLGKRVHVTLEIEAARQD